MSEGVQKPKIFFRSGGYECVESSSNAEGGSYGGALLDEDESPVDLNEVVLRAQAQEGAAAIVPGTWTTDGRRYLRVATPTSWFDLLEVQLEGKKRMSVEEFLRGVKLDFAG